MDDEVMWERRMGEGLTLLRLLGRAVEDNPLDDGLRLIHSRALRSRDPLGTIVSGFAFLPPKEKAPHLG